MTSMNDESGMMNLGTEDEAPRSLSRRAFLDGVATQIIGPLGDGRWVETPGGWSDFEREYGGVKPKRREQPAPGRVLFVYYPIGMDGHRQIHLPWNIRHISSLHI